MQRRRVCALILAGVLGPLAGCAQVQDLTGQDSTPTPSETPVEIGTTTIEPTADPDEPSGWGPTLGELTRAHDLAGALPLPGLVSTVLMPGFWGYDGQAPSSAEAAANQTMHGAGTAAEILARRSFGGVFLRPEVIQDAAQIDALNEVLHEAGDRPDALPLLVAIDQEGGAVQRLQHGVDEVPSAQSIGATGDPRYAREVARANGETLHDLGVTMVFAPVADYDPTGYSALGSRTYSRDVRLNARLVKASMEGYLDAGVVPVLKHFPGLGTVSGDSHGMLVHQGASLQELEKRDFASFRTAIEAGAPAVMMSHVALDAVNPDEAASVRPEVVEGILREDLAFQGVVVTDSQGMAPIHEPFGPGEGAVRSLLAGNDLVLNSPSPAQAFRAVRRAAESGRLTQERLVESATRVLALRIYQQRLAG